MFPKIVGYDGIDLVDKVLSGREIVFGIPAKNVAHTIGFVLHNIIEGVNKYGIERDKVAIIVADGLSKDSTVDIVKAFRESVDIPILIVPNIVSRGKGGAMKLVIDIVSHYESIDTLVFLDSDLRSISPQWIPLFVRGVKEYGFVAPFYLRHKYDATITNFLARPLTTMAYGIDIKQPIGGDFGLNRELIDYLAKTELWYHNYWAMLFGVDIFITHSALYKDINVCEADLKAKIHEAKDPAIGLKNMFIEVTGSLYTILLEYSDKWCNLNIEKTWNPPLINEPQTPYIEPWEVKVDFERALKEYTYGLNNYRNLYEKILGLDILRELLKNRKEGIESKLWTVILLKTLGKYKQMYRIKLKNELLNSLYYLWQGRLYHYYRSVQDLGNREAYKLIEEEVKNVFSLREDFIKEVCSL